MLLTKNTKNLSTAKSSLYCGWFLRTVITEMTSSESLQGAQRWINLISLTVEWIIKTTFISVQTWEKMGSKHVHCPKTLFLAIKHFLTSKYSTSISELFQHKYLCTTCMIFNFLNTFKNLEVISNVTGVNWDALRCSSTSDLCSCLTVETYHQCSSRLDDDE